MAREKLYKKCPRCGEKTFVMAKVCDNCKLVFSRLEFASNKKAKKCIWQGKREEVIKSQTLPKDLNKWKLFFMALFGGFFGLHNIYIGRYVKGYFSLFFILFITAFMVLADGNTFATWASACLFLPGAWVAYFWFYDALMIGIGKYRVPIALDLEIESVKEK